jgi:hypothetical protein
MYPQSAVQQRVHYTSSSLLIFCAEFARFVSDIINICSSTSNKFRYTRWEIMENLRGSNI